MSSNATDDEFFEECDSLLCSYNALKRWSDNGRKKPILTNEATRKPYDNYIEDLKPLIEFKLLTAALLVTSHHKEHNRRYQKRCEQAVQNLEQDLKSLHTITSSIRTKYIALVSYHVNRTVSTLSAVYRTIIPEATNLIEFKSAQDHVYPEHVPDLFEYDSLISAMHAFNNVLRALERVFDAAHIRTETTSVFKKRLRKANLLKYFLSTPSGLHESNFMQLMSYMLRETYLWYLRFCHDKSMLGLKLKPLESFEFLFRKTSSTASVFLQKNERVAFPSLQAEINETVEGFELVSDELEEAQIEFLDYN